MINRVLQLNFDPVGKLVQQSLGETLQSGSFQANPIP